MNDITALSPVTPEMLASLRLSALNLAEGEMMSFEPAVFQALVEALEARDAEAEWMRKRIEELESRTVTVKLPQRLQPGADGYDDWYVHSDDDGEYLKPSRQLSGLSKEKGNEHHPA